VIGPGEVAQTLAEAGNATSGPVILPGGRSPQGADRVVPIGRHGQPREEIRAVQQAKILDAFVAEVGEKGLVGARVIDVCRRAGVSAKEFYAIFGSKEECFFVAFDLGADQVCGRGEAAFVGAKGPWEDRLRAAIEAMLEVLAANPAFSRLCIVEAAHAGPAAAERLNGVIKRCRKVFGGDREFDVPPWVSTEACESALVGGALQPLAEYVLAGRAGELADLAPLVTYVIALIIVGQPRALRQLEGAAGG
jgi:AcrR family transcriptional regulator